MRTSSAKVRVVVADDHPIVREGVIKALNSSGWITVVEQATNGRDALAAIHAERPDVAVLDYRMPHLDGAQVAAAVDRDKLGTRILLLSAHIDNAIVFHCLENGVAGFLSKDSEPADIVQGVLDCAAGRQVLSPELTAGLIDQIRLRRDHTAPVLSDREREVLHLIADGTSIAGIAAKLFIAPTTVKTHMQRLYQKLGVSDRGAAVAEAMRQGLME